MLTYLVPFVVAFLVTYVVTPLVRKLAIAWGIMDAPDARKVHTEIIPRLGGVAIFVGYMSGFLSGEVGIEGEKLGLILGTTVLVAVGLWDDIKQIGPKTKLLGQIVAAFILVVSGICIDYINTPWGHFLYFPKWLAMPFTIFWLVAFTNIVNLIDGLDGLAAGISVIACVTIFSVTYTLGQVETAIITAALAGAAVAFLKYNFNPAKIFMGDTGSMLLGYTLGAISVIGAVKTATMVALVVPVIVLGVPIMDTAFAIIRRYMNGRPIFKPDKGHVHHRLMAMGMTHKQAVLLMYAVTAIFGCLSIVIAQVNIYLGMILIFLILVTAFYMATRIGVIGRD